MILKFPSPYFCFTNSKRARVIDNLSLHACRVGFDELEIDLVPNSTSCAPARAGRESCAHAPVPEPAICCLGRSKQRMEKPDDGT